MHQHIEINAQGVDIATYACGFTKQPLWCAVVKRQRHRVGPGQFRARLRHNLLIEFGDAKVQ